MDSIRDGIPQGSLGPYQPSYCGHFPRGSDQAAAGLRQQDQSPPRRQLHPRVAALVVRVFRQSGFSPW